MADINSVVLTGRVGQNPEMKYFESGTVNVSFSIAVNKWSKKDNKELTNWFKCIAWGKQAEFIGEYVKQGHAVTILGELDTDKWTDEQGNKKEKTYILVDSIVAVKQGA